MSFNISTKIWRDIYMYVCFQKEILDFVMTFHKKKSGKNISKKNFIIMLLLYVELWRRKKSFLYFFLSLPVRRKSDIFSPIIPFAFRHCFIRHAIWTFELCCWFGKEITKTLVWSKKKYTYTLHIEKWVSLGQLSFLLYVKVLSSSSDI